jgi:hypothetical protein
MVNKSLLKPPPGIPPPSGLCRFGTLRAQSALSGPATATKITESRSGGLKYG